MTSPYGLRGRAAIVTGASRGIGLAVAEELAGAGARVCVTARDADAVGRTAERLGGVALAGSVADPAHLRAVTELALREFGRIDLVVNNAATNQPYGPLMDVDPDRWRTAFTVNVEAALRLAQYAWHGWMGEHGGAIVNVCTEGADHVGPRVGAYGTSKAALLHLTRQLAGELAPRVRVNSVSPAWSAPRWPASSGRVPRTNSAPGSRWAGSADPWTWREPWCGWPPTPPSGSPAPICWSTEGPASGPRTAPAPPCTTGCAPAHPTPDDDHARTAVTGAASRDADAGAGAHHGAPGGASPARGRPAPVRTATGTVAASGPPWPTRRALTPDTGAPPEALPSRVGGRASG